MTQDHLSVELKPCPKCHTENPMLRFSSDGEAEWFRCKRCGFNGPTAVSADGAPGRNAAEAWNTPADQRSPLPEGVEGLVERLQLGLRLLEGKLIAPKGTTARFYTDVREAAAALASQALLLREAGEALKDARQFIMNGVEYGYIRMPDPDTPDSAHQTLPTIEACLSSIEQVAGR